jgi:tricarballylate dehydrogenase
MPDHDPIVPSAVDVVVVGGGHAALCAAITACERGASVALFEAAPPHMRGGNTRHTRNLRARHEAPTATLAGAYTEEEYWNDLLRVTDGHTNERLARLMIRESAGLGDWLVERGVRFQPALSGTLSLGRTNAFFLGGGKALLNALYRHAESIGVHCCYDAPVTDVEMTDGCFQSATVRCGAEDHQVCGNALVVASGGFQSNEEWMRDAWGNAADNFLIRGTPYNTGGMLRCLMNRGIATIGDPTQCHAVAIDARAPKYDGGIVSRLDCVCFSVVVNRDGLRFYDEGEDFWPKRYAIWGRLVAQQPGQIAYAVIDSKVTDNFMPSVFPPLSASDLPGLAKELAIDGATLERTVTQFNGAVRSGTYDPAVLDDCHTDGLVVDKSHWALPIDEPPYYAYPLRPGITFTYLALEVNERAQVIRADGVPCSNIYAAGEVMAGNILGQGYCAGTGMTIGGVFGRIAGANAA